MALSARPRVLSTASLSTPSCAGRGQTFPLHPGVWLVQRGRFSGLYKEKESFLYVSNGQSNWGPRVRLYSTPENTVLVLRHAETFAAEGAAVDLSWRRENWWAVLGLVLLPGWVVGMIVSHSRPLWLWARLRKRYRAMVVRTGGGGDGAEGRRLVGGRQGRGRGGCGAHGERPRQGPDQSTPAGLNAE